MNDRGSGDCCIFDCRVPADDSAVGALAMNAKSLKNYSDEEILALVLQALLEIRNTETQYGEIKILVSGGRVKFLTVEKPLA